MWQIRSFLRTWLQLLKKSLMENVSFCAVALMNVKGQSLNHSWVKCNEYKLQIFGLWKTVDSS